MASKSEEIATSSSGKMKTSLFRITQLLSQLPLLMKKIPKMHEDDPPFFFDLPEQARGRIHKRSKKLPNNLPDELKYAHLGPRVAAILANKDKEKLAESSDGLAQPSLLPEIQNKVAVFRRHFDSVLDSQALGEAREELYNCMEHANDLLLALAEILYLFTGLHPSLPRSLEQNLVCNLKELIGTVHVVPREWQVPSNREAHLAKTLRDKKLEQRESTRQAMVNTARSSSDEDIDKLGRNTSTLSVLENDVKILRPKSKLAMKPSNLLNIAEKGESSKLYSRAKLISKVSKRDFVSKNERKGRPKGDKELIYPPVFDTAKFTKAELNEHKKGTFGPTGKIIESTWNGNSLDTTKLLQSGPKEAGYWAVINFQLSNKVCDDMGWIVHEKQKQPNLKDLLEWATLKLQDSIKKKNEYDLLEAESGKDKTLVRRYYGDTKQEQLEKIKGTSIKPRRSKSKTVSKGEPPIIPDMVEDEPDKTYFFITLDGDTTVYYPSGNIAIVYCCIVKNDMEEIKTCWFYTFVYADEPEKSLLAIFTPWGHTCCYSMEGQIIMTSDKEGGIIVDEQGFILKSWKWPPASQKLPVSIDHKFNSFMTVKYYNVNNIQLQYTFDKDQIKFNAGISDVSQDVLSNKENTGVLLSNLVFSSKAARELSAQTYVKPVTKAKGRAKNKRSKNLYMPDMFAETIIECPEIEEEKVAQKPDSEKVQSFAELIENDPYGEKILLKLQDKVKTIVEDWLDHYRTHVGVTSPMVSSLRDIPVPRTRDVKSAKPGGEFVLIEREATAVPSVSISLRSPSAPTCRASEEIRTLPSPSPNKKTPQQRMREYCVKFDDTLKEMHLNSQRLMEHLMANDPSKGCRFPPCVIRFIQREAGLAHRHASQPSMAHFTEPSVNSALAMCPVALRMMLLGQKTSGCCCSRNNPPYLTDLELDDFVKKYAPDKQLIVIAITNSALDREHPVEDLLNHLYIEKNHQRSKPCAQCRADPFRLLWYDMATAGHMLNNSQSMLSVRHNVQMGMFLIYEGGKLVFCDHIFNGYGNARKDFMKQLMSTRRAASSGHYLPADFKFSAQRGRHGMRSPWGGEMCGLLIQKTQRNSFPLDGARRISEADSLFSDSSSNDVPIDYQISGVNFSTNKVLKRSVTESVLKGRLSPAAKPSNFYIRPHSQPLQETENSLLLSPRHKSKNQKNNKSNIERVIAKSVDSTFNHLPEIYSSA